MRDEVLQWFSNKYSKKFPIYYYDSNNKQQTWDKIMLRNRVCVWDRLKSKPLQCAMSIMGEVMSLDVQK